MVIYNGHLLFVFFKVLYHIISHCSQHNSSLCLKLLHTDTAAAPPSPPSIQASAPTRSSRPCFSFTQDTLSGNKNSALLGPPEPPLQSTEGVSMPTGFPLQAGPPARTQTIWTWIALTVAFIPPGRFASVQPFGFKIDSKKKLFISMSHSHRGAVFKNCGKRHILCNWPS